MLFFQQSLTWIEIDKHNANDDTDTERVEEKLLSGEVACGFELSFVKDYQIY